MKFPAMVEQALGLLQRQGRVSYRLLRREFDLDDELLADLKEELLYSHATEVREEGPGVVWVGTDAEGEKGKQKEKTEWENRRMGDPATAPPPPASYTPGLAHGTILGTGRHLILSG